MFENKVITQNILKTVKKAAWLPDQISTKVKQTCFAKEGSQSLVDNTE